MAAVRCTAPAHTSHAAWCRRHVPRAREGAPQLCAHIQVVWEAYHGRVLVQELWPHGKHAGDRRGVVCTSQRSPRSPALVP